MRGKLTHSVNERGERLQGRFLGGSSRWCGGDGEWEIKRKVVNGNANEIFII